MVKILKYKVLKKGSEGVQCHHALELKSDCEEFIIVFYLPKGLNSTCLFLMEV